MNPKSIHSKILHARSCMARGNHAEGMQTLQSLLTVDPNSPDLWYEYGRAAMSILQLETADRAWTKACQLAPNAGPLFDKIGCRYAEARQFQKAHSYYARAIELNPKEIRTILNLAILHERTHNFPEARKAAQRALDLYPGCEVALYYLASLDRREGKPAESERKFQELLAKNPQDHFVHSACRYEMAQFCDKRGEVDDAVQFLRQAKHLVRMNNDVQSIDRAFDAMGAEALRLVKESPKNILSGWSHPPRKQEPSTGPRLALLAGHPRSGTTLLEQILAAHPEIIGLDEPASYSKTIHSTIWKTDDKGHPIVGQSNLGRLSPAQLNFLRNGYIHGLETEAGAKANGHVLLDKNPELTMQLRTLLQLFPDLKIIVALRDPRDVVLSCFFMNVGLAAAAGHTKFLTFKGIVDHYCCLMDIWLSVREWDGLSWIETRYEDVVADMPKEGRRVTEFLGLRWDERQGAFHESAKDKVVNPQNFAEVTKPVYKSAIGRWKAYEKYLAPFLPALEPYCKKFGYE